jgi:hypothetical protein
VWGTYWVVSFWWAPFVWGSWGPFMLWLLGASLGGLFLWAPVVLCLVGDLLGPFRGAHFVSPLWWYLWGS